MNTPRTVVLLLASALLAGCSTYVPPSGRADFSAFTSSTINESLAARPTASFPVGLAWARVQEPGYSSLSVRRGGGVHGTGRYSVLTTREVEGDGAVGRIAALPEVAGIVALNRLLLPTRLESDEELRHAAARLKAEMLVLYTFDTVFMERNRNKALTLITLGASRSQEVTAFVTASALVMDTRTGFIYAAFESTEERRFVTSTWNKPEDADAARLDAERAAFNRLVGEFEAHWPRIVERAGRGA